MKLVKGDRIYVDTLLFEGYATVEEVFYNEFFPVQVRMDGPDNEGHKVKRVNMNDIVFKKEDDGSE